MTTYDIQRRAETIELAKQILRMRAKGIKTATINQTLKIDKHQVCYALKVLTREWGCGVEGCIWRMGFEEGREEARRNWEGGV